MTLDLTRSTLQRNEPWHVKPTTKNDTSTRKQAWHVKHNKRWHVKHTTHNHNTSSTQQSMARQAHNKRWHVKHRTNDDTSSTQHTITTRQAHNKRWHVKYTPDIVTTSTRQTMTNVWKTRVYWKKPTGLGFSVCSGFIGFFGFYWVLSGFTGFCVLSSIFTWPKHSVTVLLNFSFRCSSKYIAFYAKTMICTCESDQSKFICMIFAWYLVKKTVF